MVLKSTLRGKNSGKRGKSRIAVLSQTQTDFMEVCGRFAQVVGLSRSLGTIYGLLYLSHRPVGLQEIAQSSQISKGSASMGTRQLLNMGLIRKVWMPEEKRDFYEAIPKLGEAFHNLYQNLLKSRMENSQKKMGELVEVLESEKKSLSKEEYEHINERLKNLDQIRTKISRIMPAMDALL